MPPNKKIEKIEKVEQIKLTELHYFKNHPFKVRDGATIFSFKKKT